MTTFPLHLFLKNNIVVLYRLTIPLQLLKGEQLTMTITRIIHTNNFIGMFKFIIVTESLIVLYIQAFGSSTKKFFKDINQEI